VRAAHPPPLVRALGPRPGQLAAATSPTACSGWALASAPHNCASPLTRNLHLPAIDQLHVNQQLTLRSANCKWLKAEAAATSWPPALISLLPYHQLHLPTSQEQSTLQQLGDLMVVTAKRPNPRQFNCKEWLLAKDHQPAALLNRHCQPSYRVLKIRQAATSSHFGRRCDQLNTRSTSLHHLQLHNPTPRTPHITAKASTTVL